MPRNDPERSASKELNDILVRELIARGDMALIDDVIDYVVDRYTNVLERLQRTAYRNLIRGRLMGLVKRNKRSDDKQIRMFPELLDMPEMLTYPTGNGMALIKRDSARREHWDKFIEYITAANLRAVQHKNALYVQHNERLEAQRRIHGDLPESELIALATNEQHKEANAV